MPEGMTTSKADIVSETTIKRYLSLILQTTLTIPLQMSFCPGKVLSVLKTVTGIFDYTKQPLIPSSIS
jgi:hypothetical protein